jgi:hypothetical protein
MHLILTHKEKLRHLTGRGSGVSISIRPLTQKMELHAQIGNLNDRAPQKSGGGDQEERICTLADHREVPIYRALGSKPGIPNQGAYGRMATSSPLTGS